MNIVLYILWFYSGIMVFVILWLSGNLFFRWYDWSKFGPITERNKILYRIDKFFYAWDCEYERKRNVIRRDKERWDTWVNRDKPKEKEYKIELDSELFKID
jgi:hypothetical protein